MELRPSWINVQDYAYEKYRFPASLLEFLVHWVSSGPGNLNF